MHYARLLLKAKADVPMHLVIAKIRDFQMLKSIYGAKKADEMLCYLASAYNDTEKHGIVGRKGTSSFLCLLWGTEKVSMSKMEDVVNEIAEQSPMKEWKVKYGVYENIDKHLPFPPSVFCGDGAGNRGGSLRLLRCGILYRRNGTKTHVYPDDRKQF